MSGIPLIRPRWPAPANVRSAVTTRAGGISSGPWATLNLGDHVGDDPQAVAANRELLRGELGLERAPLWVNQVHGTDVLSFDPLPHEINPVGMTADGVCTRSDGVACAIMTADCLPVLLCDRRGTVAAAAHAGWRGLAAGILRNTVAAMACDPADVLAWLGPAIGPDAFEVGSEVREAFQDAALNPTQRTAIATCFAPSDAPGKYRADLYALAAAELAAIGVPKTYGGGFCTFRDTERFYSYRRDGETGRMASLIWLAP
ncbi:MAG: peptidoglycan editing factor PgeF [Porticoccaceae bacterium]